MIDSDKNSPWGQPEPFRRGPSGTRKPMRNGSDPWKALLEKLPGEIGGQGGFIALLLAAVFGAWLLSSVYYVDTDEQGVVLRFGKSQRSTAPGIHLHWPWPIETALTPKVTKINRVEIGAQTTTTRSGVQHTTQIPEESLILTGDENIVDVNFAIFWRIKEAADYLFNIRNPELTIKALSESAMREVIGQSSLDDVLTRERLAIQDKTKELVQTALDRYHSGMEVTQIQLKKVDPPEQVIDAFRDVQRAKADQERIRNQAEAYRNEILPKARGEAERILQEAEAYMREIVARSEGDSGRFNAVLKSYRQGADVTTRRIYIETMEEILSKANKVILDGQGQAPLIPYLPLPEVQKRYTVMPQSAVSESISNQGVKP